MDGIEWNSSERRRGVDKWPETQATVTRIDQPFTNRYSKFLSVISFTFKDKRASISQDLIECVQSTSPKI